MRWSSFLTLLLLLFATSTAWAQEGERLHWNAGGGLRVRGLSLSGGTLANQLDPTTRNALRLSGDDEIDSTQNFLDTRLRLRLTATAYNEVSAVFNMEIGDLTFGAQPGGGLGTDGVILENKNLYLEWHPTQYSFKVRGGLYPRESDPYGLILSNDVAGIHGEVELLGTDTLVVVDFVKAIENSRLDLDGDGVIDNDYNDRTIFMANIGNNSLEGFAFELFGVADIDNSQDTPVANTEQDTYWLGLAAHANLGPVRVVSTGIYAYGKRTVTGSPGVTIRGYALDQRLSVELPFVTAEIVFGWASGRDPNSRTTDNAFPTITPFYGQSGIIYSNFGGFNLTGSNLSGTAHGTLRLTASPIDKLDLEAVFVYAWYTSDTDVSQNVNKFNDDARDLGFEMDLNATYEIVQGFKTFGRGSIFFPGKGHLVRFDTRRRGALAQLIVGAQMDF